MDHDPQNKTESTGETSNSLEEVRKRLQSFGYLNSRIERFYLLSLSRTASLFFNRVVLSLRVGLLAGTLAAILMTIGTLVFNEDLLRQKTDIVLLFFYFEIFFVLIFSFLELLLIFLVAALVRFAGGRRLFFAGQTISFLVGLGFFAYFFYWGRTQIEYLRLFSTYSLLAIFVILTLSCIFVAKCCWLGFLVAFRESDTGRILPNWRRYAIEVMLSLAAILILVPFVLARGNQTKESETPIAVMSTPDQWIVVGIDGLSMEILNRFVQEGSAAYLQQLLSTSWVAPLRPSESAVPPVTWTTIATGVPSVQHGIRMPEVRRWRGVSSWLQMTPLELAIHSILVHAGFGQRQPVSGYLRKVKTFWEILSDSGIRTGVVNWWGSWPARPLRGWDVSERYYYKLKSGEKSQNETFPPNLFQRYAVELDRRSKISGDELDRFYANVFQHQLQDDPVRVGALYLPGFDILNYEFFEARQMDPFTYTNLYAQHIGWLNSFLQQLKTEHPDYRLMLILHRGRSLTHDRSVLLISDTEERPRPNSTFYESEVTPMLLYSCGAPLSRSMSVDLVQANTSKQRLAKMPIRFVRAYTHVPGNEPHVDDFNDLLIEQMKSLGYLQ